MLSVKPRGGFGRNCATMTDVEKKVDMSLDELVAMRQKEAKKKVRVRY